MISVSGILNTIIWLGTLQGFILASLLWFLPQHRRSSRLLAVLILLMALASLHISLFKTGILHYNGVLATLSVLIPLVIVMPVGPLLWLYVTAQQGMPLPRRQAMKWHFLPVVIDLVPSLTVIVYFAGVLLHVFVPDPEPWGIFLDNYSVYADIPRWLSLTVYVLLAWRSVRDNITTTPNKPGVHNKWLRQFCFAFLVFQGIWLLYLIPYINPATRTIIVDVFQWYPIYIPLTFLIYWLGFKGYSISQRERQETKKYLQGLPATDIQEIVVQLQDAMAEHKAFLNPDLDLATLSALVNVPQKTISAVLNQHLNKSFSEWVNSYRIEMFKVKVRNGEYDHLTIAGLASECGFSSLATFQRIFKAATGMSPSEFKKSGFHSMN